MENNGNRFVTILGLAFVIWFFVSVGFMIYLASRDMWPLMILVFGQVFLVFGTVAILASLKDKKFDPVLLIFPLVGVGCIAGGCIFQFGSKSIMDYVEKILPYLFLGLFFIIGMGLVIGTYFGTKRRHEKCNYCITATCVDVKTSYNKGSRTYCPVYEVYFRGEMHRIKRNIYSNVNHVAIGDQKEVYLNPDNPEEFYEPREEKSLNLFTYILGISFAVVSVFALVMTCIYA